MRSAARTIAAGCLLVGVATAALADESLRSLADARGFHIGAAVAMVPFRADPAYRDVLKREFNMLVAENAFKWSEIHPGRSTYTFDDTDALVAFAEENGMAVRGHTLAWHNQNPGWLTNGAFTRDEAIAILRDHIETVVGRYRGRIAAWDVVNEAMGDDGRLRQDAIWYRLIGPDYIEMAFRFARDADPAAKLYYNDYNAERLNDKANAVYELVKALKQKGVPIDGVGWQMHLVNGFSIDDWHEKNAARLGDLGLEISITELDVRTALPTNESALQRQGKAYGDVTAFCLAKPNCDTLVMWGFTDAHSWIPGFVRGYGDALPFDARLQPKPAYWAIHDTLLAAGRGN